MEKLDTDVFNEKYKELLEMSIDKGVLCLIFDSNFVVRYLNNSAKEFVLQNYKLSLKENEKLSVPKEKLFGLSNLEAISNRLIDPLDFVFYDKVGQSHHFTSSWLNLEERRYYILKVKQLQNKMVESEELTLFKSIAEQSRDAIIITDAELDKPGPRIEFVNEAYLKLTGYPKDEIIGKTPRIMQGEKTDRKVLTELKEKIKAGESFSNIAINYKKNGEEFINEWVISPIKNQVGEIVKYFAIIRDVTEREFQKKQLEVNESKFRSIIESSHYYIVLYNIDYTIKAFNTRFAEMMFLDFKTIISEGDSIFDIFKNGKAKDFIQNLTNQALKGKVVEVETINNLVEDDRWYRVSLNPAKEKRTVNTITLSFQDIDKEKRSKLITEQNEHKYRTIVDSLAEGIVLQNKKGEIIEFNQSALDILGLTPDQLSGRSSYDPKWQSIDETGKDFPGEEHPISISLNKGINVNSKLTGIRKPSGALTWLTVNSRPIFDEKGRIIQAIASMSDVTEEVELRKLAEESGKRFEVLFSSNPVPMIVIETNNEEDKIHDVNQAFLVKYGYTKAEFLRLDKDNIKAGADEIPSEFKYTKALYDTEKTNYEIHKTKNNSFLFVSIHERDLDFESGNFKLILYEDITEEILHKSELEMSEKRYRNLFESNPNALLIINAETGKVLDFNQEALIKYKYTSKEFHSKSIFDLFEKQKDFDEAILKDFTKISPDLDYCHINSLKSVFYVNIHHQKIQFQGHEALLLLINDVTKRRLAEHKLRQTEGQISSLVKNNPVGVWSADTEGNLTFCVGSLFNTLNLDTENILGKSILNSNHQLSINKSSFKRVLNGEEVNKLMEYNGFHINSNITLLKSEEGIPLGVIGVSTDVTKLIQAQNKLEETSSMLQMTQAVGKIGGWKFNLVSNHLEWSDITREIHEVASEFELDIATAINFYHPDYRSAISEAVDLLIKEGKAYNLELKIITGKSNHIWVRTQGVAVYKNNEVVEIYGTFQNINELKIHRNKQEEAAKLFALSDDLVSISGFDGKFEFINPAWERTLGYSLHYLTTRKFESLVHPDDLEITRQEFDKLLYKEGYKSINFKNRYKTKKGNYIWLSWSTTPDFEQKKLYAIAIDITDQVNLQKELINKETFYRKLAKKGFSTNIILTPKGRIKYATGAVHSLLGIHDTELKGKKIRSLIYKNDQYKLDELMELGKTLKADFLRDQLRIVHKNKSIKWVEVNLSNLLDDSDIEGLVINLHDITETMDATKLVVESEHRYRLLVEKSPIPIFIHSDYKIAFANEAAACTLGGSIHDLMGMNLSQFIDDLDLPATQLHIQDLYSGKASLTGLASFVYKKLNGDRIHVEMLGSSITYNQKPAVQVMFLDITERAEAAAAIRESELRYRSLVNNSPMPILIHVNGIVKFLNTAAAYVLGGNSKEFLDQRIEKFIPKKERKTVMSKIGSAHKKHVKTTDMFEMPLQTKDGKLIFADMLVSSIDFKGQSATQLMFLDVTEKKNLLNEQLKLKNIVTESNDSILVFGAKNQQFTFANNAALKLIDLNLEEIKKLTPSDFKPTYIKSTSEFNKRLAYTKESERPFEYYGKIQLKNGSVLDVKTKLQYLKHENEYVLAIADITDQIKFQRRENLINQINALIVARDSKKDVLIEIIGLVAEVLGFDLGEIWRLENDGYIRHVYAQGKNESLSCIIELNKNIEFKTGDGVLGKTFLTKEVQWVSKLTKQEVKHYKFYVNSGVKTVVIFPLIVDDQVLGAGKLYGVNKMLPDEDTVNLLKTIGGQIGQFKKRKNMEIELQENLKEKDGLLKEIHHRVKNNLQTVSSLLYLRSSSITDPDVKRFFIESQNRISAITFTHERLLRAKSYIELDISTYFDDLINNIYQTHRSEYRSIEVHRDVQTHVLKTDIVMNCGMILNELLINAFDHAFDQHQNGNIWVSFKQYRGQFIFSVEDDGKGFDMNQEFNDSIGVQLVQLFTNQLKGTINVTRQKGTKIEIKF